MLILGSSILGKGIEIVHHAREKTGEVLANNYYIGKRAVLHGLPIAVVSTIALGYLFGTAGVLASAAYGAVNYTVTAVLIELHGPEKDNENDYLAAGLILGGGCVAATIFVQTVLKTYLSYQAAIPLAIGAFVGNLARSYIWENEPDLFSNLNGFN